MHLKGLLQNGGNFVQDLNTLESIWRSREAHVEGRIWKELYFELISRVLKASWGSLYCSNFFKFKAKVSIQVPYIAMLGRVIGKSLLIQASYSKVLNCIVILYSTNCNRLPLEKAIDAASVYDIFLVWQIALSVKCLKRQFALEVLWHSMNDIMFYTNTHRTVLFYCGCIKVRFRCISIYIFRWLTWGRDPIADP